MNRLLISLVALSVTGAAFAQKPKPAAPAKTKEQTNCPMMTNKKVDANSKSVAYAGKNAKYKGKSVKVCCGMCEGAVKKDPDKFFAVVYGK